MVNSTSPPRRTLTPAGKEIKVISRRWSVKLVRLTRCLLSGFEGLTLDSTGNTLYAMLQSATIQDGGDDKDTSRYTRLLAYDVSSALTETPPLIGEWVVPLPQTSKGKTLAQSEIHFVKENVFLVLARDGDGHGGDDDKSSYKYGLVHHSYIYSSYLRQADLFDITNATDIHGTVFDSPSNPIADDGKLDKSITPATYAGFVDFIDNDQLARFGVHNGMTRLGRNARETF